MRTIYLDNNATTRPSPGVVDAVREGLEARWHNPSSVHRPGQDARHAMEKARAKLAALIGVSPRRLTLTASGTESVHLAFRGLLGATGKRTVITTAVEHAAVRDLCELLAGEGVTVRTIPLDDAGAARADAVEALIDDDTALVSVQWANNETGVVHPVGGIGAACRARGVPFHCDATQWVGKMPCDLSASDAPAIDLLTFSAHKFHGPKGVGGLWTGPLVRLRPVMPGSQELGRRGGTENLACVLGAGVAAEEAMVWLGDDAERARLGALRDRLEALILERCPGAHRNPSGPCERLWNTANIAFPRLEAEALLMGFSEKGLCASAGAACSSGSLDPSPVLLAMGIAPESAHGSVRFSLSRETTDDEIGEAAGIVGAVVKRLAAVLPG
ncbi:MAG: cysteine desulfurase [Phycisphaerales bacterium]|nr:cysteine desulfurase [Planctomycetota bacterium]MCH8508090.1 cysteine desulfurase [Phycisphaerales bacterium]